jgi:hypothetical protein
VWGVGCVRGVCYKHFLFNLIYNFYNFKIEIKNVVIYNNFFNVQFFLFYIKIIFSD